MGNEFFRAVRNKKHPRHEWANRVLESVVEGMLRDGEPGFINASQCEVDEAPGATFYSTNPCVTGDTLILTSDGITAARNLTETPFEVVYDGKTYRSEGFFETGTKPVYEVLTEEGSRIEVTADHQFLTAGDTEDEWKSASALEKGDHLVIQGMLSESTLKHVSGLMELLTNLGSETGDGTEFVWIPEETPETAYQWKAILNLLGIRSILKHRKSVSAFSLRLDKGDMKRLRQALKSKGLGRKVKSQVNRWMETVQSVRYIGEKPVYDCTVEKVHCYLSNGFVSHNCGEIPMMRYPDMKSFDVCCLGHVNLAFAEDPVECFRLMARFLLRATFAELPDPLTRENVQRNRRIGVGFLGFHEWLVQNGIRYSEASSSAWVARQLRRFRDVVREEARRYAHQMRIPEPIKRTTVAPTGTINNIPGVTSGIQPLYAPFYIRRVRYSNSDEELGRVLARGDYLSVESDVYAANTTVVSYACRDVTVERLATGLNRHDSHTIHATNWHSPHTGSDRSAFPSVAWIPYQRKRGNRETWQDNSGCGHKPQVDDNSNNI